jgi:hypothetical protein
MQGGRRPEVHDSDQGVQAGPPVAGLLDPARVRAAMAPGAEGHGPAMTGDRNQRPPGFAHSAVRSCAENTHFIAEQIG